MAPYKKTMTKACDVCGKSIKIDRFGNGKCKNCGWVNDRPEFTKKANYPNFLSLEDARKAYRDGKMLLPTFEIFLDILSRGFEMALWYNGKKYGAMKDYDVYDFYLWDNEEGFQEYNSIKEFAEKANIGGVLLKDLWGEIKKIEYDC